MDPMKPKKRMMSSADMMSGAKKPSGAQQMPMPACNCMTVKVPPGGSAQTRSLTNGTLVSTTSADYRNTSETFVPHGTKVEIEQG